MRSAFLPSRDVAVVLGTVFMTLVLGFFPSNAAMLAPLRLSSDVVTAGHVWQLLTYPLVAVDGDAAWIVAQFAMLFMFARDLWLAVGRKRFWTLLVSVTAAAGLIAVAVQMLTGLPQHNLALMQGQSMLLTIVITGYAAYHGSGRVLLVAVPLRAHWLLVLVFGIVAVQMARVPDVAGLIGRLAAIGLAWGFLRPGALGRTLRRIGRRLRIGRIRRHGLHVVTDEPANPDRWVH